MSPHDLEWTDEERELLKSAEHDAPDPGSRQRVMASLGIGAAALGSAAVAGTAHAAEVATAAGSKTVLFAKWLAVLAVGGVAGGAALHYQTKGSAPAPAVVAKAPAKPTPPLVPQAPAPRTEIAPVAPPRVAPERTQAPSAPSSNRSEPNISLEIEALDRARRASERGDFGTALAELDRYDREFTQGRLRQEALLLRVQTLIGKGDRAGAKALGERFLTRYPKSPLAPRIHSLIGG